jgi:NAD(P)-dependent dehydrogenase (short-subunit alcohol dehydrogenase family)
MTEHEFGSGVVLVVGGSGGIGSAITTAFASRGVDTLFTYHSNAARAEQLLASLKGSAGQVMARQLALEEQDTVAALLTELKERYQRIIGVVYAAGPLIKVAYVSKISAAEWQRVFALDTHGCFNLVHAALPLLTQQGGGSLVAVTTVQFARPELRGVLSAAPKGAVEMLFRAVAAESARFGIRANTVRAGWIDAGMTDTGIGGQMSEEAVKASLARIPMGRMGRPRDIAEAVVYLTSQRANYITGIALTVDGGMSL